MVELSPIGVGFSYSNTSSDYISWNDTQTGHYIPQLAALLLDYNKQPNIKPVKLKAIALGNPLLDIEISVNDAEYLWSHGVISDEMLMLKNTVASTTIVGDPCLQDRVFIYLNKPQVQEALQANTTHLSYSWSFLFRPREACLSAREFCNQHIASLVRTSQRSNPCPAI
ncbi:unnamed protein product [Camellia sinensis]